MLVGYHPLYITQSEYPDDVRTLKMKVAAIGPDMWYYPECVSQLAKDLIGKLCHMS